MPNADNIPHSALAHLTAADLREQLYEVRRELRQRAQVYPRLVSQGRLSPATAAHQVRVLEQVVATLTALLAVVEQAGQRDLFEAVPWGR